MTEVYVPYPFEVTQKDTITLEKAQIAQQMIQDIQEFCESNLSEPYEISKVAYAKGIKVNVQAYDDAEKLLEWQVN
jgi:hypothetical protein